MDILIDNVTVDGKTYNAVPLTGLEELGVERGDILPQIAAAAKSLAKKDRMKTKKTNFKGKEKKAMKSPRNTEKHTKQAGKQDI